MHVSFEQCNYISWALSSGYRVPPLLILRFLVATPIKTLLARRIAIALCEIVGQVRGREVPVPLALIKGKRVPL